MEIEGIIKAIERQIYNIEHKEEIAAAKKKERKEAEWNKIQQQSAIQMANFEKEKKQWREMQEGYNSDAARASRAWAGIH
jgi:hypothetical protein